MKLSLSSMAVLSFAATMLFVYPSRADVVGPDPESCPSGSSPSSCHGGPYCSLATCTTTDECDEGETCQSASLCTTAIDCGGIGGPAETTNVLGACVEACTQGTCTTHKVCSKGTPGTGGNGGTGGDGGAGGNGGSGGGDDLAVTGCACSLENGRALGGAAGALALLAGLALTGRRRDRRPAKK